MFHSILVAVDGSPSSDLALEQAIDLARSEAALLTVMTVTMVRRPPGMPESALVRIRCDKVDHAQWILGDAVELVPDDLAVDTLIAWGSVEGAILDELETGGHDLLVLGSRGRGAVRATLLGSVGHTMLRRCPVPVLIVRTPERRADLGREENPASTAAAGR